MYVANELSIEKQIAQDNGKNICENKDEWVARILEIRASDEHHVYARVYWMYWPDELPAKTVDGKKEVQGRQPYHGVNELIASNHSMLQNGDRQYTAMRLTDPSFSSGYYQCCQCYRARHRPSMD